MFCIVWCSVGRIPQLTHILYAFLHDIMLNINVYIISFNYLVCKTIWSLNISLILFLRYCQLDKEGRRTWTIIKPSCNSITLIKHSTVTLTPHNITKNSSTRQSRKYHITKYSSTRQSRKHHTTKYSSTRQSRKHHIT